MWRLQRVPVGLDAHGVIAVGIELSRGYDSAADYGTEGGHDFVTPDYFRMLRIPLRAGRYLTPTDRSDSVPLSRADPAGVLRIE